MKIHRDRRATPLCAKSRPPLRGRPEKASGYVACLRVVSTTRLRCEPCRRPSPGDHGRCRSWVRTLSELAAAQTSYIFVTLAITSPLR